MQLKIISLTPDLLAFNTAATAVAKILDRIAGTNDVKCIVDALEANPFSLDDYFWLPNGEPVSLELIEATLLSMSDKTVEREILNISTWSVNEKNLAEWLFFLLIKGHSDPIRNYLTFYFNTKKLFLWLK